MTSNYFGQYIEGYTVAIFDITQSDVALQTQVHMDGSYKVFHLPIDFWEDGWIICWKVKNGDLCWKVEVQPFKILIYR